jgi:ArsR family transcriptional regulator
MSTPALLAPQVANIAPATTPSTTSPLAKRAQQLKALGDETRLTLLLNVAASTSDNGACICDLIPETQLAQSTLSHHMKVLVDADLVTRTQRGKWAYFEPTSEGRSVITALGLDTLVDPRLISSCS